MRDARWRGLVLTIAALAVASTFPGLNHGPARIHTWSRIDASIPLIPMFVLPYLSLFVFVAASAGFLFVRHPRTFATAAGAALLTLVASGAIYAVAQSYIAPPHFVHHGVAGSVLRLVYAADGRYNAFPSLHVGLSTVLAIHWWRSRDRLRWPMVAWAGFIVVSTVLIKQHFVADVVAGLVVAVAASAISARLSGDHGAGDPGTVGFRRRQAVAATVSP